MKDRIDHSRPMPENPFMSYNHIEIGHVERDHACVILDIVRDSTNIYNVVHGGAYFTMADCCAGLAARTDGRDYVTQDASVQFIRNTKSGRVTARSTVLNRGRTICLVEVSITDSADILLFHGVFSMFCTGNGKTTKES